MTKRNLGNKEIMSSNIKRLMNEKNLSITDLSKEINQKYTTVVDWVNGVNYPRIDKIEILANYFGVNKSDLVEEYKPKRPDPITVKVYDCVPAGTPIEALDDNVIDIEELDPRYFNPVHEYIGLLVKGDSMYPRFIDGDVVIIQVQPDCESGQDAVVYINGYNATLKTVYKHPDSIELRPVNTAYSPKRYGKDDEPIQILGVVKELRRKF